MAFTCIVNNIMGIDTSTSSNNFQASVSINEVFDPYKVISDITGRTPLTFRMFYSWQLVYNGRPNRNTSSGGSSYISFRYNFAGLTTPLTDVYMDEYRFIYTYFNEDLQSEVTAVINVTGEFRNLTELCDAIIAAGYIGDRFESAPSTITCLENDEHDTTITYSNENTPAPVVSIIDGDAPNVSNLIQSPDGRTSVVTNDGEIRAQLNGSNVLEAVEDSTSLSKNNSSLNISDDSINLAILDPFRTTRARLRVAPNNVQLTPDGTTGFASSDFASSMQTQNYTEERSSQVSVQSIATTNNEHAIMFCNIQNQDPRYGGNGSVIVGAPAGNDEFIAGLSTTTASDSIELTLSTRASANSASAKLTSFSEPFIAEQPADITTKQYVDGAIEDRAFTRNPDGSIILSVLNSEGVLVGSLSIGASGHGIFTANNSFGISAGGSTIGVDSSGVRLNRIPFSTAEIQRLKELAGTTSD